MDTDPKIRAPDSVVRHRNSTSISAAQDTGLGFCHLPSRDRARLCADESTAWIRSLTSDKGPGNFTAPPSMRLSYRFGWSGIQAATADIHFFSPNRNTFEVDASGATSGFPRTLFRLDIYHQATENKATLRPIHFFQEEKYRQETVKTNVDFEAGFCDRTSGKNPERSSRQSQMFSSSVRSST